MNAKTAHDIALSDPEFGDYFPMTPPPAAKRPCYICLAPAHNREDMPICVHCRDLLTRGWVTR
jgi:hypothetical protein